MLRVRPSTVLTLLVPCAMGCASDAASKGDMRTLQASVKQLQDENLRLFERVQALETERAVARAGQQPLGPLLAAAPSPHADRLGDPLPGGGEAEAARRPRPAHRRAYERAGARRRAGRGARARHHAGERCARRHPARRGVHAGAGGVSHRKPGRRRRADDPLRRRSPQGPARATMPSTSPRSASWARTSRRAPRSFWRACSSATRLETWCSRRCSSSPSAGCG